MLTGNLIRARVSRDRVYPLYLDPTNAAWLEVAEGLLLIFREGIGMTRGEIRSEIEVVVGRGVASVTHQGLAKVLEDRAEFEVVSEVPPEQLRERVFTEAAEQRKRLSASSGPGLRERFEPQAALERVGREFGLPPASIVGGLFADLKDENRLLKFDDDLTARRLIERYNVALAQAALLRSVSVEFEVRGESPSRYRQLFRYLKFHRLLYRVQGSMERGYRFRLDGPLSLFTATNKYGLQMALFLPALLLCRDYRLEAELRWGKQKAPKSFVIEPGDGLVSHHADTGRFVPAEIAAFVERFRRLAGDAWEIREVTEILPLGRDDVWVPDYRFVHQASGTDVFVEILGFWKRSAVERLLALLPRHGPPRYVLAISDRLKVDDESAARLAGPVLRFKEIPNAQEMLHLLNTFLPNTHTLPLE